MRLHADINCYLEHAVFNLRNDSDIIKTSYHRPIFHKENMTGHEQLLFKQRVLFNIYEHDLIFLPSNSCNEFKLFEEFYSPYIYRLAEKIRPELEVELFENSRINYDDNNTIVDSNGLKKYFDCILEKIKNAKNELIDCILNSNNRKMALDYFLIQCAGDFLTEASGMSRNLPGNYGMIQSELFKIFIDEYGYGVHQTKHSTAYEKLLEKQGLYNYPHAYWNYYLKTSLALHNYIHYICKNHRLFFRYIGALYFAEATYADFCKNISKLIKSIMGDNAETYYFDEHNHIDRFHSEMVFQNLIIPIIEKYGERFIKEIIHGFHEFKFYLSENEKEIINHINFNDKVGVDFFQLEKINQQISNQDQSIFTISNMDLIFNGSDISDVYISPWLKWSLSLEDKIIIPEGIHYGFIKK